MRTSALRPLALAALLFILAPLAAEGALNPDPPSQPVKLIFIHHSTGENWLSDGNGDLGLALMNASYFVSDTNYGWGPLDLDYNDGSRIGDHTDIGNFYSWFSGPNRDTYLADLYPYSEQNSGYTRLATDPGGENTIVMFKSCFPNSALGGSPSDPIPDIESNPLRGQDYSSGDHTVANAKGIYRELLNYFGMHTDKLFVLITAPPLIFGATDATQAANARALNDWLVTSWLASYPYRNVFVFDFYNVMTSNGGDPDTNDLGSSSGNHHRYRSGAIEHMQTVAYDMAAYPIGDSHPTSAGNLKATGEFPSLLNIAYHCWVGDGSCTRPGMGFYVLPPCRVVDTRWADGPYGGPVLAAGASRTFTVAGQCGVPAGAVSVATNLTVTQPQAAGSLFSCPGRATPTGTSVVSFGAGRTRATNAALVLAADGSGGTVLGNSSAGSVHVILDVTGYWK